MSITLVYKVSIPTPNATIFLKFTALKNLKRKLLLSYAAFDRTVTCIKDPKERKKEERERIRKHMHFGDNIKSTQYYYRFIEPRKSYLFPIPGPAPLLQQ